jgi:hypothetical protein
VAFQFWGAAYRQRRYVDYEMNVSELFKESKLDWTNLVYSIDSGTRLDYEFQVQPKDYLNYSKKDFTIKDRRGKINAISNAKRAIDCQIDKIFMSLGYKFDSFPSYLEDFSNFFCETEEEKDLPIKLRIIVGFGLAPCGIVSDVRNLRNKIEHYYVEPSTGEVRNAIEIADLFINATERKLIDYWDFEITSKKRKNKKKVGSLTGLYFSQGSKNNTINVIDFQTEYNNRREIKLIPKLPEYAPVMRMALSTEQEEEFLRSLKYLLKLVKNSTPLDKVNITRVNQ